MVQTADMRLMPRRRSPAPPTEGPPGVPRRGPKRARTTGYSRFVGLAKLLLVTLAAGLIVLLVVWSQLNIDEHRLRIGVTDFAPDELDSLNMVNPRFEGMDDDNRPFSITAEAASQADESGRIIKLAQPKADITLTDGAWIALTADVGRYSRDADMLELYGGVNLFHDRGFELQTSRAQVDLKEGVAFGNEQVRGQGPAGELVAEGFRVTDDGDRVFLTGQSRIVLYSESDSSQSDNPQPDSQERGK
ncbi:LPS export ABC transporter periplasmic protein LptC [Rhodospirillaceae bacterium SYSU D60014]|uniref:LPS export ABC transporter periplasmic protein LptC n=1 Tax=Virgifigura deserti TaxID=2268457 RepID=UPI000E6685DE